MLELFAMFFFIIGFFNNLLLLLKCCRGFYNAFAFMFFIDITGFLLAGLYCLPIKDFINKILFI